MTQYEVYGPYAINVREVRPGTKVRTVIKESDVLEKWWEQNEELSCLRSSTGCYVLAMEYANRHGFTPWYVGKTDNRFDKEVFTADKRDKMNEILGKYERGRLVVFLISSKKARSNFNDQMEWWLIGMAIKANPDLLNDKKRDGWSIKGMKDWMRERNRKEAQPLAAAALARTLNLKDEARKS